MLALAYSGQRSNAIMQFEICRDTLKSELDVDPTQETVLLHQQILGRVGRNKYACGPADRYCRSVFTIKKVAPAADSAARLD